MKITIYSLCWNEEKLLPYYFAHYKKRFPEATFIIYDNQSTDRSKEIVTEQGGTIIEYDSENSLRDDIYINIKNNCWKTATTDWVIVCDIDELVECTEDDLKTTTASIIKSKGYDMVGSDLKHAATLNRGMRAGEFDKCLIFNSKKIEEINYSIGAHHCRPEGYVNYAKENYILRHMKSVSLAYLIDRNLILRRRLSALNNANSWSAHYKTKTHKLKAQFYYSLFLSESLDLNSPNIPEVEAYYLQKKNDLLLRLEIGFYVRAAKFFSKIARRFSI